MMNPLPVATPQERPVEVTSFGYPNFVPSSIREQLRRLKAFGLPISDVSFAEDLGKRHIRIPEHIECLAVVPKPRKIARNRNEAIEIVFRELFGINMNPNDCLLTLQTLRMLDAISDEQRGDVMVFGVQLGNRHKNVSPKGLDCKLETERADEFMIDTFSGAIFSAVNPSRFVGENCLRMDTPGSITDLGNIHYFKNRPAGTPGCPVKLNTRLPHIALPDHGIATGFRLKLN